jgi:hypothetical protein
MVWGLHYHINAITVGPIPKNVLAMGPPCFFFMIITELPEDYHLNEVGQKYISNGSTMAFIIIIIIIELPEDYHLNEVGQKCISNGSTLVFFMIIIEL